MKKQGCYHVVVATLLGLAIVFLTWNRASLTLVQFGCLVVVLLAVGVLGISDFRKIVFRRVVAVPMIVATWICVWTLNPHRDFLGMVVYGLAALFFIWFVFMRTADQGTAKTKAKASN